jgi:hypothetical protein
MRGESMADPRFQAEAAVLPLGRYHLAGDQREFVAVHRRILHHLHLSEDMLHGIEIHMLTQIYSPF